MLSTTDGTRTGFAYYVGDPAWAQSIAGQNFFNLVRAEYATNEIGITTARYFDARDLLRLEITDTAGLRLITVYDYDELGRIASVISPSGDTTRYWYDEFGRTRYKYQPDIDTISYAYDALGNLRFSQTQQQANDNLLTFTEYDDLNRVTLVGEAKLAGPPPPSAKPGEAVTGVKRAGPGLLSGAGIIADFGRWTDRLDPNALHNGDAGGIPTANRSLVMGQASGVPRIWGYGTRIQMQPPCNLEPQPKIGETTSPLPPYLGHAIAYEPPITDPAAPPELFENAGQFPHFIRTVVAYDTLPERSGPVWWNLPAQSQWNAIAPLGMIRNLKGREAVVAYREHGGQPFYYTMLSYDERGRVEALLRYTDNIGFDAVYYTYNSMNQVTSIRTVDAFNQHGTWYGYDHNGRIDTVWSKLVRGTGFGPGAISYPPPIALPRHDPDAIVSYTKTNLIDSVLYPPILGSVRNYYNRRKWLDSLVANATDGATSQFLFRQGLAYDSAGRITAQTWQHRGRSQQQHTYGYDGASRLTDWVENGQNHWYTYDAVGNRQLSQNGPVLEEYAYNPAAGPNRLQQVMRWNALGRERTDYAFDADGAVSGRQKFDSSYSQFPPGWIAQAPETFAYSYRDLLWKYTYNGPNNDWRYRYSASGEREQKRQYPLDTNDHASSHRNPWVYYLLGGSKEQLSVWHGQEIWLYDSCLNLNTGRVYMYPFEYNSFLGGLARVSTAITQLNPVEGTKRFHIADHLGSVRVAIDPAGMRTELDYEPFGKATVTQFTVDVPRQTFIDKEKDGENGLGDFGVRKYEEETGRFMSVDALWEKYRWCTPYHYVDSDPLRESDPSGLGSPLNLGISLNPDVVATPVDLGGGGASLIILGIVLNEVVGQSESDDLTEEEAKQLAGAQQEKLRPKKGDKADSRPAPEGRMGKNQPENRAAKEIRRIFGIKDGTRASKQLHDDLGHLAGEFGKKGVRETVEILRRFYGY